jgi:hypothetical protein
LFLPINIFPLQDLVLGVFSHQFAPPSASEARHCKKRNQFLHLFFTKEALIVRVLAQRELRFKLARFTDNPEELAISYRRESLRDMCREAGIWRSGNKRALSAGLLNWRDRCRARGQAFLAEMQSLAKDRPQQLTFRFQLLS